MTNAAAPGRISMRSGARGRVWARSPVVNDRYGEEAPYRCQLPPASIHRCHARPPYETWNCSRPVTKLSGDVLVIEAPADRSALNSSPSTPSWNSVGRNSGTGINNDAASSGVLAERIRRATSTNRRQTAPSRSTAASSDGRGSPRLGPTSPIENTRDNESSCEETRFETEESTTDARRVNRNTSPPTHASTDDSSS